MKFARKYLYWLIYWPIRVVMSLWHWPVFRGRENLPKGAAVICCNHAGMADPVWVVLAMKERMVPWIMAKKSALKNPILGGFLKSFGAFGVDRDNPDLGAIKKALTVLKSGEKLLIFPEGTRVRPGKIVEPKSGAVMLAHRAGVPIVPVFLTPQRRLFQSIQCIIGKPYFPRFTSAKPSQEELHQGTQELMKKIYQLGETG